MTPQSALLPALAAELSGLRSFLALLEREQGMLVENLTDQLVDLSAQKSSAAVALHKLAETRHALLQRHIPQQNVQSIKSWLGLHCKECLPVWLEIVTLSQRAQQINQANGELIQMKLRHNQQALSVLINAVNKSGVYGRNGQPDFSAGSSRSLGSV